MILVFFMTHNICSGLLGWAAKLTKALSGPRYDGKYLYKLIRDILKNTRLHQTITSVAIPTFDIKKLQPTIFSSYQVLLIPCQKTCILNFLCLIFSASYLQLEVEKKRRKKQ